LREGEVRCDRTSRVLKRKDRITNFAGAQRDDEVSWEIEFLEFLTQGNDSGETKDKNFPRKYFFRFFPVFERIVAIRCAIQLSVRVVTRDGED